MQRANPGEAAAPPHRESVKTESADPDCKHCQVIQGVRLLVRHGIEKNIEDFLEKC